MSNCWGCEVIHSGTNIVSRLRANLEFCVLLVVFISVKCICCERDVCDTF